MRVIIHGWKKAVFVLAIVGAVLHTSRGESASSDHNDNDSADNDGNNVNNPGGDRIVQSLFRFPASQLGPGFDAILQSYYKHWLHATTANNSSSNNDPLPSITPEPAGLSHAFYSVSTPAATLFRRQCYGPAPSITSSSRLRNLYNNLEQRRKEISFQYMQDSMEEMRLMHTVTNRFYPAFLPLEDGGNDGKEKGGEQSARRIHKKKSKSTIHTVYAQTTLPQEYDSPSKLAFQTFSSNDSKNVDNNDNTHNTNNHQTRVQQEWSWNPPAHFSSRGTPANMPFRRNMYKAMRHHLQHLLQQPGLEYGRQSGMFWYPPGGVREWHNNNLDLVGNAGQEEILGSQVWRMYFVRTVRDAVFDEKLAKLRNTDGGVVDESNNDHSAMHIIPGEDDGITLDVLQKAGARPLNEKEKMRQWSDEFAEGYTIPSSDGDSNAKNMNEKDDTTTALDRNAVWRIPDQDGYVTLFRLPSIWHCIVSEEVHRYSLGFAFSDGEVQALLGLAGVDFDVLVGGKENDDHNGRGKNNDEL